MTDEARAGEFWRFVRTEPLVHFLAIAALLFIADALFAGDDRELVIASGEIFLGLF